MNEELSSRDSLEVESTIIVNTMLGNGLGRWSMANERYYKEIEELKAKEYDEQ